MAIFSLCPHIAEGARALSEVSSVRTPVMFMKDLPSGFDYRPRAPTLHIITFRIRISAYKFGRNRDTQFEAVLS